MAEIPGRERNETAVPDRGHLLRGSKVFCLKPWINLTLFPNGAVQPCCEGAADAPLGSLKESPLGAIWNGERTRELRRNMLAGRPSRVCARCYELESVGYVSTRLWVNQALAHHFHRVAETTPEGALTSASPAGLDLMLSNACNFRCRSCSKTLSSAWSREHGLLYGDGDGPALLSAADDPEELMRQLEEMLPGLEQIYFAGGEPLLLEAHYRLLEKLLERGRTDVLLQYSTNLSTLSFGGWDAPSLWNRFRRVKIGASLDAPGRRGEYIRKGQDWAQTVANRERLLRECPQILFHVAPALSVLNAFSLPDFHREWLELGYVRPGKFKVGFVLDPEILRLQILPAPIKKAVAEKYSGHIDYLRRRYGGGAERDAGFFRSAVSFMMAQDLSCLLEEFRCWTRTLDRLRGERLEEVFPEYAELMRQGNAAARLAEEFYPALRSRRQIRSLEMELASVERRTGRRQEALGRYLGMLPDYAGLAMELDILCALGELHLEMGRPETAEESFRKALALAQGYPWQKLEAKLGLAVACEKRRRWPEALSLFEEVLAGSALFPDLGKRARYGRGRALAALGRLDESEEEFAAVLEAAGPPLWIDGRAAVNLAEIRGRRGNAAAALAEYEAVLRRFDGVWDVRMSALYGIGRLLLQEGRLAEAEARFRGSLATDEGDARQMLEAQLGLAAVYERQERWGEALRAAQDVFDHAQSFPELALQARYERGCARLGLGQAEEAESDFSAVLAPADGELWMRSYAALGLAEIERRRGRTDAAIERYDAILQRHAALPEVRVDALCGMGRALLQAGRPAEAEASFRAVAEKEAAQPWRLADALLGVAEACARQGRAEEALERCRQVLQMERLQPGMTARAHCQAAQLHLAAGRRREAAEGYRAALALAPGIGWLRQEAEAALAEIAPAAGRGSEECPPRK